ncbi:MAG TPA: hypothetical protein VGE40_07050, partial [Bacilli bacterium]
MKNLRKFMLEIIVFIISLTIAAPLYIIVINSFKNQAESADLSISLPQQWNMIENYKKVFIDGDFLMAFWNTSVITVFAVVLTMIASCSAAYIIQRRQSKATKIIFYLLLAGMLLPGSIITTYQLMDALHLVRTYTGVIL